MPRRLVLVVNPAAGGGRTRRLLPAVEAGLRAAGHDLLVRPTRSLEHADELAAAGVADDRTVVALGGDGLVGRVAGGVADAGGLLGVLPGGRGNDFARAVGLPRDPGARSPSWSTAGSGASTWARSRRRRAPARSSGSPRSASTARCRSARSSPGCRSGSSSTSAPRSRPSRAGGPPASRPGSTACRSALTGWTFAVSNSGTYGGGMRLAPAASVVDGLLDVVTVGAISRTRFLRALPDLFRGTHVRRPGIAVQPAVTVELDADRPFRVFADGDPVAALPCTLRVRAGALRVLLPDPPAGAAA